MRTLVLACLLLLPFTGVALAQEAQEQKKEFKRYLYQWTDKEGGYHITDSVGNIPPEYRAKASRMEDVPAGDAASPSVPDASPSAAETEQAEQESRNAWRQRIRDLKAKINETEQRYRELEARRIVLLSRGVNTPNELKLEAERIEGEMKTVRGQIDELKRELNIVIPDDARRQGVPPGWLRE